MNELRPYQAESLSRIKQRLKEVSHPLLVTASVGAGKSILIAELLKTIEKSEWRALCLTLNSELIRNNCQTYVNQGGNASIYCAGLNSKKYDEPIVFASPQSLISGIKSHDEVENIRFNLIVIDEAHIINHNSRDTMFMRIIHHYGQMAQTFQYPFRILGLTGTPFRDKNISIWGEKCLFKEEIVNISMNELISLGYLVKPEFGLCPQHYDFSKLKVRPTGDFNNKEMQDVIDKNERLTASIMREIIAVIESGRHGAFIFAATKAHCEECAFYLPKNQTAIITADTDQIKRIDYLERARTGEIKYLINISCLTVGIDVPLFDVCAWLRPTESMILYTQGIGRVLRSHPLKKDALVLDYAGNIERLGDIDDPIINQALQPKEGEEDEYCIPCYKCTTNNKIMARRCIGISADTKQRCDYYFEWKDCRCGTKNDKTARHCRECHSELIDPNAKLFLRAARLEEYTFTVQKFKCWIAENPNDSTPVFCATYNCTNGIILNEQHYCNSTKAKNITYGSFIRLHFEAPSDLYPVLNNAVKAREIAFNRHIRHPQQVVCVLDQGKRNYRIKKKIFQVAHNSA